MTSNYIGYKKLNLEGKLYFMNKYPNLRCLTIFSVSLNHIH